MEAEFLHEWEAAVCTFSRRLSETEAVSRRLMMECVDCRRVSGEVCNLGAGQRAREQRARVRVYNAPAHITPAALVGLLASLPNLQSLR